MTMLDKLIDLLGSMELDARFEYAYPQQFDWLDGEAPSRYWEGRLDAFEAIRQRAALIGIVFPSEPTAWPTLMGRGVL